METNPRKDIELNLDEKEIDKALRPKRLRDFSGQDTSIQNLEIFIDNIDLNKLNTQWLRVLVQPLV